MHDLNFCLTGSDTLSGPNFNTTSNPLNGSIFINGNLARVLLSTAELVEGEKSDEYLKEGLRWCETLCKEQQRTPTSDNKTTGYWGVGS